MKNKIIIIFGIVFLLMFTTVSANRDRYLNVVEDNTILNLNVNQIIQELDITYDRYEIKDESTVFYYNIIDYDRVKDPDGVVRVYRISRSIETYMGNDVLSYCIENEDCNRFINNEKIELFNGKRITPIKKQLIDEIQYIKDKIEGYKTEIRRDRNPIINFIESFNFNLF